MTRGTVALVSVVLWSSYTSPIARAEEAPAKQTFDSDGVPIQFFVTGREDGEPVVLIHGFSDKKESWAPMIAELKKDYRIVAPDCRGHGGSGKPHDRKQYGLEMVHDVSRLLDHLKIEQAHVVGYSMGAALTLSFTVNHPNRVRTLTLGGTGAPDLTMGTLLPDFAAALEQNNVEPIISFLAPRYRPKPSPEQIAAMNKAFFSAHDGKALAAAVRAFPSVWPTDKQIEEIQAPALAVIGGDDPVRPGVDAIKNLLPKTKVVVLEKKDHWSAWASSEWPKEARRFLDDHRQTPKN